jgi:hypothetical protein
MSERTTILCWAFVSKFVSAKYSISSITFVGSIQFLLLKRSKIQLASGCYREWDQNSISVRWSHSGYVRGLCVCNFTTNFLHLNTNSLSVLHGDTNLFCVFIGQYRCLKRICVDENGQVCMKKLALLYVKLQTLSGYVCNAVDRSTGRYELATLFSRRQHVTAPSLPTQLPRHCCLKSKLLPYTGYFK